MPCQRPDVRRALAASAAALAVASLVVALNAFTIVVAWCFIMRVRYATVRAYDIVGCLLAGFVFTSALGTVGLCLYGAAYSCFLASITYSTPDVGSDDPTRLAAVVAPTEGDAV